MNSSARPASSQQPNALEKHACGTWVHIHSFRNCHILFHCMGRAVCSPTHQLKDLGLFPLADGYEWAAANLRAVRSFCGSAVLSRRGTDGQTNVRLLSQEPVKLLAEGLFLIPTSKVCVSSSGSHPHQQLLLSDFLILTFVTGVLAASHWSFHLHFPDGEPGWVFLCGCISHQCVLSEEEFLFPIGLVSNSWVLQALCMFPKQVLLSDMWFAKAFPQFVA